MKRRIRMNVWGNWYGYEGTRRTREFADLPYASAEVHAKEWLAGGTEIDEIMTEVAANTAANGGRIKLWRRKEGN